MKEKLDLQKKKKKLKLLKHEKTVVFLEKCLTMQF
jgi:hypothetical protein